MSTELWKVFVRPRRGLAHVHVGERSYALLPFGVGLLHGLAGSGALAALVLATEPELKTGMTLLAVYSVGTVLGMALLAGVLGKPLQHLATKPRAHRVLLALVGALSLLIGLAWGARALA